LLADVAYTERKSNKYTVATRANATMNEYHEEQRDGYIKHTKNE
jgi:hypothetical protein